MQQYQYDFALVAPAADQGVVTRELHYVVDGTDNVKNVEPVDSAETSVVLDESTNVSVYLVDIDGAGNRSEPSPSLDFTVSDIVPPSQPGAPGVARVTPI